MNKPFYKKQWFWLTIIAMFFVITATAYVVENTYEDKADEENQERLFNKSSNSNTSTIDKFNSIKLGAGGSDRKAVDRKFGKAVYISNSEDEENSTMTWNNIKGLDDDVSIDITFEQGIAVAKSIKGLDIDRKNDLTMKDYNRVKNNDSYEQVINTLGNPDNYSEKNGNMTLIYTSDVEDKKDDEATYIKVVLNNNKVTSKSQVNVQ
ncbi:DUF3862 domain-containing protein [Companilactobacillus insicii]|uniref:DUF3862 domain-containing protein n=1 Tax=Companilactobacillus insicii TaxID=1732567 RepID=UPI000F766829|nr:DUF3862 domain-containing protein [Companilactobacillus insicii]